MRRDPPRQIGNGDFLHGTDVINAEMLALLSPHHDAGHQVVDEAEAARLLAGALDFEAQLAGGLALARCLQAQR